MPLTIPARVDYAQFLHLRYAPPHTCFKLVQRVFEQAYGVTLDDYAEGVAPNDTTQRAARFHEKLTQLCYRVEQPQEGDVIVISVATQPWHIGVVTRPGEMIHCVDNADAVIESYTSFRWRSRIEGFYRYAD